MKIMISSLGCRLNQSEIQSVSTVLQDRGHEITISDDADVVIINSCTVTRRSEQKTRQMVNRAVDSMSGRPVPGMIIVAGCIADRIRHEDGAWYVPNDFKHLIPDLIDDPGILARGLGPDAKSRFGFSAPLKASTSRVNLKIQDGCDNFCSYCIVPLARGAPQSKPAGQVADEFSRLIGAGYREVVLAGVMIGSYAADGLSLAGLVERLAAVDGDFRLHLTSLSPRYVTPELIDLLAGGKMVKHLHLSLQSGSDAVLARMNRPYTRDEYRSLADRIRSRIPDFNLTTDVIVGFPGETEEEFRDTLELVRVVGFSHVHTFRYSPRPGTAAHAMGDPVTGAEKHRRSRAIIERSAVQKREYYGRFNGRRSRILSERTRRGVTTGFNEYYVPVEVPEPLPRNRFFSVTTVLDPGRPVLNGDITG